MALLGLRFCVRAFSSCDKRGPLFIAVHGPLTIAASCCGAQAPDAQAQQLWLTGPVAPRHVGSSQTRAGTRVPCIGRQTLNHCTTREALMLDFFTCFYCDIPYPLFLNSLSLKVSQHPWRTDWLGWRKRIFGTWKFQDSDQEIAIVSHRMRN